MRNLKKVLSLTLALVMMLGMMTFAGAAETTKITSKDLTDMDKVVNKEAVTLLVDLGIINGIKQADGTYTFNPAGNIERGAYAKMVYAVKLASNNADVYKGANTGLTDVKGHWAEGFIAYCVSTKIAAGNTNKTFAPNANITVVAASKMLLTALGYDAKLSKYENDNLWAINIMADAQSAGLMNGVNLGADAVLTRDAAAQMIFNALFSTTVTPVIDRDQGVAYLTEYKHAYTTLGQNVFGLAKVTATVNAISPALDLTVVDPADGNLTAHTNAVTAAVNPDSGLKITADMVGCNVTFYSKNTVSVNPTTHAITLGYKSLYSSTANGTASTVLATVTGGIDNFDNAVKSGHADFVAKVETGISASDSNYKISTYLNGTLKDNITAAEGPLETTFVTAIAKAGVITEFIDTDADGIAEIVKATEKTVETVGAAGATTKTVNGKVQVKVAGVTGLTSYTSANTTANVFGYEGLKEDDVVLSYTSNGNYYIEKAAMVTGQLTATKGSKLIIGGTNYTVSGLSTVMTFDQIKAQGFNADVNYYLDNGGHIVKAVAVEEAAKAQYAFVTGWTNKGAFGEVNVEAKLLMEDGTSKTVKVSQFSNAVGTATDDVTIANTDTTMDIKKCFGDADAAIVKPVMFAIDKDGNYKLTNIVIAKAGKAHTLAAATILNNTAVFCPDDDGSATSTNHALLGNAKTVFLMKDGSKTKVVTGIANAPHYSASANGVAIEDKDGMTVMVYITDGTNLGTDSNLDRAYIVDNTTNTYYPAITGKTDAYYEYEAIIAGETTTIKVAEGSTKLITSNTVYTLTLNKDGLVTGAVAVADDNQANNWFTGVKYMDGIVRVGVADGYDYYTSNADSLIYVIDGNTVSTVKASELAEDGIATVLAVSKGTATADLKVIKELFVIKNSVLLPADITVSGTATLDTNKDLLKGLVKVKTGAAATTVIVTPHAVTGSTFSVTVDGAGTDVTHATAAEYALDAKDSGKILNVTIKITVTSTGATQTLKYQIPVDAVTVP